jgi:hypothetical protein
LLVERRQANKFINAPILHQGFEVLIKFISIVTIFYKTANLLDQVIPRIQIIDRQAVLYGSFEMFPGRTAAQIENEKNLRNIKYNGYMSPKTRCKVRKYLSTWIESVKATKKNKKLWKKSEKPYLTFATTTLSAKQAHTDNEIKRRILTPFITELKREFHVEHYFWRAESQENGNIHFHILCDKYIDKEELQALWNRKQNVLGYVDKFQEKYHHEQPPSTHIMKLEDKRSATAYVLKYVSKSEGYRPIQGRIHGCSDGLREMKCYDRVLDNHGKQAARVLFRDKRIKVHTEKDFTVLKGPVLKVLQEHCKVIFNEYNLHLNNNFMIHYTKKIQIQATTEVKSRDQRLMDSIKNSKKEPEQMLLFNDKDEIIEKHQEYLKKLRGYANSAASGIYSATKQTES